MDALEWQYLGLKLVETLIANDPEYFTGSNHKVGRRRRHEEAVALRRPGFASNEEKLAQKYQMESKRLDKCLIRYSAACPEDVELLFELLKIFLSPTVVDYSFVKAFFRESSSVSLRPLRKLRTIVKTESGC